MSIELNQLPCEFCKRDCPGMDLDVDSMKMRSTSNGKIVDQIIILRCRNEELCKYLREEIAKTT